MGGTASKAARSAGNGVRRQYPTRIPPASTVTQATTAPSASTTTGSAAPDAATGAAGPGGRAAASSTPASDLDTYNPQLGAALRSLGPVQTGNSEHASPSTASAAAATAAAASNAAAAAESSSATPRTNPALLVLAARQRIAEQAEAEAELVGKASFEGRQFVDVMTLRRALALREIGKLGDGEIESELQLRKGTMQKLGRKGVVADAGPGGGEGPLSELR